MRLLVGSYLLIAIGAFPTLTLANGQFSSCVPRLFQQKCAMALMGSGDRELPIYQFPKSIRPNPISVANAVVIDSTPYGEGRLLTFQPLSAKSMESIKTKAISQNADSMVCVHLNAAQVRLIDQEAIIVGKTVVSVVSAESSKDLFIPDTSELKVGTVLKINRRRFVVTSSEIIQGKYPRLTMAEFPGAVSPGDVTTPHSFTFDYNGQFKYDRETIYKIKREGDAKIEPVGSAFRFVNWISESSSEKLLAPSKLTFSPMQPIP